MPLPSARSVFKGPLSGAPPGARSERADILRGMLILLVLFGHALQFISHGGRDTFWEDPLFIGIYMFHMPLFMALAGYFSPRSMAGQDALTPARVLQHGLRLLGPILPWALLAALLKAASKGTWADIPAMTLGGFLNLYWFLWALFMALILVAIGQRLGRGAVLLYALVFAALLSPGAAGIWRVLPLFTFTLPFFLAGRLWRGLELQALARREARVWHRRRKPRSALAPWGPALIALPVALICFLFWDRQTYAYNNGASLLADPARVSLMFLGAASATILAGSLLWRLTRVLTGSHPGQALAGCGRITLQIYLIQDLAFACLRAGLRFIPGAGSEDRAMQILLALLIAGLMATAISVSLRMIPPLSAFPGLFAGATGSGSPKRAGEAAGGPGAL